MLFLRNQVFCLYPLVLLLLLSSSVDDNNKTESKVLFALFGFIIIFLCNHQLINIV